MKRPSKRPLIIACISVGLVAVATLGFVVGEPAGIADQTRVVDAAAPGPTVAPVETPPLETPVPATPFPTTVPHVEHAEGCPRLPSAGGPVTAVAAGAKPWPTDGTVSIPELGISAPIVRVGVDDANQMVVPPDAAQVAWLDQGGIPGPNNNIVLAGHISWAGVPGAFHRIGDLIPNDMVVLSINGRRLTFRVSWVCLFDRSTNLVPRIMGHTDVPSVTLITCAGAWDGVDGTHSQRMVARAELVPL